MAAEVIQRALAQVAAAAGPRPVWSAAVKNNLPHECPSPTRQAVESLAWGQPILASAQGITYGTHRLTAMRHQGVKSTPALLKVRAGQHLTDVPGAYPHQHLG